MAKTEFLEDDDLPSWWGRYIEDVTLSWPPQVTVDPNWTGILVDSINAMYDAHGAILRWMDESEQAEREFWAWFWGEYYYDYHPPNAAPPPAHRHYD